MTEEPVNISITIKVEEMVKEMQIKVPINELEDTIQTITLSLGPQVLQGIISVLDDRIAENMGAGWRNVGTEARWMVSSLGPVYYKRRVYQDEDQMRWKPVDELLGLERYSRMTSRVREMGSALAIAKHLVEAHGGTISAESASGQGTKMQVVLPVRK